MLQNEKVLYAYVATILLTVIFFFFATMVTYVASDIDVVLDGKTLSYSDVQPQIVDDRTMVPLTETAAHFGMDSLWIAETGTMIFSGNNRTVIHMVYDNTIYVNNEPIAFNYTSTIVNDRTLMPIRMLAEAIGCEVDWDGVNGIVTITSENTDDYSSYTSASYNYNSNTTATYTVEQIQLYNAYLDSATVEDGEKVYFTVMTNLATNVVKLTDEDGNTLKTTTDYSSDTNGNYYEFSYTPDTTGDFTYRVYAGNDDGYSSSYLTVTVTVKGAAGDIEISNISLSSDDVDEGASVTATVKTSTNVTKVVLKNSDGSTLKTQKSASSTTSSAYTWKLTFTANDSTGKTYYTVYAYDDDGDYVEEEFYIYITESSSSSSSPTISSVDHEEEVYQYDSTTLTVKTNQAVGVVKVLDADDSQLDYSYSYSSSSGSYYYWTLTFYIDYEGYYYIYAYDEDEDNYDYQRIYIYAS